MNRASDRIRRVAHDYGLRACAAEDHAAAGDKAQRDLAIAWSVVEIALREIADALDGEEREAA